MNTMKILLMLSLVLSAPLYAQKKPAEVEFDRLYDVFVNTKDNDTTIRVLKKLVDHSITFQLTKELPDLYSRLAYFQKDDKQFSEALSSYLRGLNLAIQIHDTTVQAEVYTSLAALHIDEFKNIKLAKRYYDKALKLSSFLDTIDLFDLKETGHYIALQEKNYPLAYRLALELNNYYVSQSDLVDRSLGYKILAEYYDKAGNLSQSDLWFKKALIYDQQMQNWVGVQSSTIRLAEHALKQTASPTEVLAMLDFAKSLNSLLYKKVDEELYRVYSLVYSRLGNHAEALRYYKKYSEMENQPFAGRDLRKLFYEEAQQSADETDRELKILDRVNRDGDKVLSEKKYVNILTILVVMILAAILIPVFISTRKKRNLNTLLKAEGQEKELLLREVHHRVNNTLQVTSSLLAMQSMNAQSEEARNVLQMSEGRVHAMAQLHAHLNQVDNLGRLPLKPYLENVLEFHASPGYSGNSLLMDAELPEGTINTNQALPLALILNELVSIVGMHNVVEGKEAGIKIKVSQQLGRWDLCICDSGYGFQDVIQEKSAKMGMKIVTILTDQLDGAMNVDESQSGCSYRINFPDAA